MAFWRTNSLHDILVALTYDRYCKSVWKIHVLENRCFCSAIRAPPGFQRGVPCFQCWNLVWKLRKGKPCPFNVEIYVENWEMPPPLQLHPDSPHGTSDPMSRDLPASFCNNSCVAPPEAFPQETQGIRDLHRSLSRLELSKTETNVGQRMIINKPPGIVSSLTPTHPTYPTCNWTNLAVNQAGLWSKMRWYAEAAGVINHIPHGSMIQTLPSHHAPKKTRKYAGSMGFDVPAAWMLKA